MAYSTQVDIHQLWQDNTGPDEPNAERMPWRELKGYYGRIGMRAVERLQWALDFAFKDLATLTVGEWEDRRREFLAFKLTPPVGFWDRRPELPGGRIWRRRTELDDAGGQLYTIPSKDKVLAAQQEFAKAFEILLRDGSVSLGPFRESYTFADLLRISGHGANNRVRLNITNSSSSDPSGMRTLAHLLDYCHGSVIQQCPEPDCQRWFVQQRRNQRYCTNRCQSRATTRVYRKKKRAEATVRRKPGRPRRKTE